MVTIQCPECNMFHPPVVAGQCPMAKANQVRESAKADHGSEIANLSIEIQETFLKKIKNYSELEKQKDMANKILTFINSM
jgi:hypothetical protein